VRADYVEATAMGSVSIQLAVNWARGELSAALNREGRTFSDAPVTHGQLSALLERINDRTLSSSTAKAVFATLWTEGSAGDVDAIIEARGLRQVSDTGALEALVRQVVADHPEQVAQFRAGKEKVFAFFVGQLMKATQGKANPGQLNELLRAALAAD